MIAGDNAPTSHGFELSGPRANPRGSVLPEAVNDWVSSQRWFGNKGTVPVLRSIGHFALASTEPGIIIRIDLVLDMSSRDLTLYQLPTTERSTELAGLSSALITVRNGNTADARFIYDAPYDPAFGPALLSFMHEQGRSSNASLTERNTASAQGQDLRLPSAEIAALPVTSSRVLSGEQSNTSIIIERTNPNGASGTPIICKVFRIIHAGENPDVTVQAALARAGSHRIPLPFGAILGEWDDPSEPGGRATGHLAFAQDFLPDAPDAWRTALVAAASGSDFTGPAYRLGQATAEVHQGLAHSMPTLHATSSVITNEIDKMRLRCRQALTEVPALARHEQAIEAVFARAEAAHWPGLQRIHGDFHLGQVLDVPDRGWVLLDFEGEPLRTLRERTRPDSALRDVAGMLRSFSYVAGAMTTIEGESQPTQTADAENPVFKWSSACRDAFLQGYVERSGINLAEQQAVLDAFELDKALYETVYEIRNRPHWLPIPLAAVERLVGAAH